MKNPLYFSLLAAALFGCSGGKSTDPESIDGAAEKRFSTHSYTVSGSRIITPAYVDTSYFCYGSVLETDTIMMEPDTVIFAVSRNTLTLVTYTDTTPSGAVVQWESNFIRSGSGAGLPGTWRSADASYLVISGELSQGEKDKIDLEMTMSKQLERFYDFSVIFTESTLTTSMDILTAELFVFEWNGAIFPGIVPDSAKYEITVKALKQYIVELKGNITGETVRIKIHPNGDRIYTSSETGHPESRYVNEPKTCPNAYEPLWYDGFKEGNSRVNDLLPAEKSVKNAKKGRQPPHFPFFPLKPASIFLN